MVCVYTCFYGPKSAFIKVIDLFILLIDKCIKEIMLFLKYQKTFKTF